MSLVTRTGKGSKLTISEMDGNLTYLEGLALSGANQDIVIIYTKTGLTYQLTSDDMGKYILFNTGTTISIPDSGTTNIPSGSTITLEQHGVDQLTISPLNGSVTINGNLKSANQFNILVLIKTDINTWTCIGGTT
jgi:hypothetical protein